MDTPDEKGRPAQTQPGNAKEKRRPPKSLEPETPGPEEARRLLHELQVYQAELERQNEELRKTQAELVASRALYFELYDLAPVGYFTLSENGLFIETNLAVTTMLGVNRDTLAGQAFSRFVFDEDHDIFLRHRRQLFETCDPQAFELRMVNDGRPFWVRLEATAARNADGQPICRVVMSDITQRRLAEDALRKSEAYLNSVFRAAPIGIGVVVDRVLMQVNQRVCEMTGYSASELTGRSARMLYPTDEDYDHVGQKKYAQIRQYGTGHVETRWQCKDGRAIDVLLSSTPLDLDDMAKGVIFTAMDITERRRMESELREREALLRIAGHTAKFGGWSVNIADQKVVWSEEVAAIHGKAPGYSPSIDEGINFYAPEWREKIAKVFGACVREGKAYDEVMEILTVQGKRLWVRTTGEAVRDETGEIVRVQGAFQDISERKRAEAVLKENVAQRHHFQKAESLRRMAGAIAHHYNNLLFAVMGNLELATEKLAGGARPAPELSEAMSAARRASEMGGLMLAYLGQTVDRREPLDLSETCRRYLPDLLAGIPEHVTLASDLPPVGPAVRANADQIRQVLGTLVSNAREAMGERRGAVSLKVETVAPMAVPSAAGQIARLLDSLVATARKAISERRGVVSLNIRTVSPAKIPAIPRFPVEFLPCAADYACLEVVDNGCGIPETDIEKLFDPFYSTKFTGRGLGLPVALGIVKAHDGCITVESQPGRGSAFRVYLPLTDVEIPVPKKRETEIPASLEGSTVLLVEDDDAVRVVAAAMLMRLGIGVLEAGDGVDALEAFKRHGDEIRCVLCDLTMPGMNGWEIIEELRRLSPGLPVILVSGYDEASVMSGDHPELPQVFLGKPYGISALKDALVRALEGRP